MVINQVYIVESPIENAFVFIDKQTGIEGVMNNYVFLTKGIIAKMMDVSGDDVQKLAPEILGMKFKRGRKGLRGIMAHELAHPIDLVAGFSLHSHYEEPADQAIETRADGEGSLISDKAGFGVDSVYQGLFLLFKGLKDISNVLSAGWSTHPEANFRLSSLRWFLTIFGIENGDQESKNESVPGSKKIKKILTQATDYSKFRDSHRFVTPESFEAAMKRVEKLDTLFQKSHPSEWLTLEFNRLLIFIMKDLEETEREHGIGSTKIEKKNGPHFGTFFIVHRKNQSSAVETGRRQRRIFLLRYRCINIYLGAN